MTDALWNGIIGAGGAAICCAVYYGFKAAKKGFSKLKFISSKKEKITAMESEQNNSSNNLRQANIKSKQITITLPSKRQIFTRQNFRAFGFLVLAIVCFVALSEIRTFYTYISQGWYAEYEGDFYTNASSNLSWIANNTYSLNCIIRNFSVYFFGILGGLFALLGITSFSFKRKTHTAQGD